ncbi:hypothetical protein [Stenotrophomonas rhizophila]|uniref:hypothetical protein n=1 Tax=Stenotrophomonas rhizophila TaxID=216778 RepID=UPI0033957B4C
MGGSGGAKQGEQLRHAQLYDYLAGQGESCVCTFAKMELHMRMLSAKEVAFVSGGSDYVERWLAETDPRARDLLWAQMSPFERTTAMGQEYAMTYS